MVVVLRPLWDAAELHHQFVLLVRHNSLPLEEFPVAPFSIRIEHYEHEVNGGENFNTHMNKSKGGMQKIYYTS